LLIESVKSTLLIVVFPKRPQKTVVRELNEDDQFPNDGRNGENRQSRREEPSGEGRVVREGVELRTERFEKVEGGCGTGEGEEFRRHVIILEASAKRRGRG
jgi:hypothetical protein